jgi:hypothetical protein
LAQEEVTQRLSMELLAQCSLAGFLLKADVPICCGDGVSVQWSKEVQILTSSLVHATVSTPTPSSDLLKQCF